MTGKKYAISCIIIVLCILCLFIIVTYVFDPFFHYHKPYDGIAYNLNYQRYQNDGILKHFDYDAVITGTSMIENSRTSELDQLFDVKSVKVPFAGATHKEINDNLIVAIENNKNIKMVIRSLDMSHLFDKYSAMRYDEDFYPRYLYDNLIYNDVKYIFNKTIFFKYTLQTMSKSFKNEDSTLFDDYSKWYDKREFGKEAILKEYERPDVRLPETNLTEIEKNNIRNNFNKNIIQIAKDNPNIDFYLFFPPYSIYYWDELNQNGTINKTLDALEYVIEMLVEIDNINLYSFINEYDIICNPDIYRDQAHYNEKINSQMLMWMKEGHDLLTKDNYKEYMKKVRKFYTEYNYEKLFEEEAKK